MENGVFCPPPLKACWCLVSTVADVVSVAPTSSMVTSASQKEIPQLIEYNTSVASLIGGSSLYLCKFILSFHIGKKAPAPIDSG